MLKKIECHSFGCKQGMGCALDFEECLISRERIAFCRLLGEREERIEVQKDLPGKEQTTNNKGLFGVTKSPGLLLGRDGQLAGPISSGEILSEGLFDKRKHLEQRRVAEIFCGGKRRQITRKRGGGLHERVFP